MDSDKDSGYPQERSRCNRGRALLQAPRCRLGAHDRCGQGWLLGGTQYGGSTITQQLIKNITATTDYSVKRKVNEIFRAFALEKEIDDKDRILVMYLNTIYLGYNSYGVQTAAMQHFDKRMYRSWIWQNPPCWQVSPTIRRFTTFITIPKR